MNNDYDNGAWLQGTIQDSMEEFGKIIKEQWKDKTEMKPTLEDLLKQREELDKRIEELKNEDIATLIKIRDVIQLYNEDGCKVDPLAKNQHVLEAKEDIYIRLSDFLTVVKEGRLEIK